jgi:hypothetical protein
MFFSVFFIVPTRFSRCNQSAKGLGISLDVDRDGMLGFPDDFEANAPAPHPNPLPAKPVERRASKDALCGERGLIEDFMRGLRCFDAFGVGARDAIPRVRGEGTDRRLIFRHNAHLRDEKPSFRT